MIERSTRLDIRTKRGKPFSELQKLNNYYRQQRFVLLGARSNIEVFANRNPTCKRQAYDALIALGNCLDVLANEYERDKRALTQHSSENNHEQV